MTWEGARHIPVGYVCPEVIPGHRLHVAEVMIDQDAIRVEYMIEPPLPFPNHDAPPGQRLSCRWYAEDDLGTRYEECGGAYGPSTDAERMEGVLSLNPLPLPAARSLKFYLHPFWESGLAYSLRCTFEVDLG